MFSEIKPGYMGAKNYCKDKRDQAMRDYYQAILPFGEGPFGTFELIINNSINTPIQPASGQPYYIGGKKGGESWGSHFKGKFNTLI